MENLHFIQSDLNKQRRTNRDFKKEENNHWYVRETIYHSRVHFCCATNELSIHFDDPSPHCPHLSKHCSHMYYTLNHCANWKIHYTH